MEELNLDTFKKKIIDFDKHKDDWKFEGELPAIVKYTADWCQPCKSLTPILENISKEYNGKINIYEVDVDSEPELSFLFDIKSVPTMLFIPMIGEPQIHVGTLAPSKLKNLIESILLQ